MSLANQPQRIVKGTPLGGAREDRSLSMGMTKAGITLATPAKPLVERQSGEAVS